MARFHCRLFGSFVSSARPESGRPNALPKQLLQGSSKLRVPATVFANGGFAERPSEGLTRSRTKNRPRPARSAVLPVPETSHARPRRGANRPVGFFMSDLLGAGALPPKPSGPHGSVPGTTRRPLQGLEPNDALKVSGL